MRRTVRAIQTRVAIAEYLRRYRKCAPTLNLARRLLTFLQERDPTLKNIAQHRLFERYEALKDDLDAQDKFVLDNLAEFYDIFADEMPYGTMKARTGDPVEWIHNRLNQ